MLLFLRRRIVRYVVAAIAIPLIGMLVLKAGNEMESRRGASMGSRSLRKIGAVMQNRGLGRQLRSAPAR
ncbi:MAG: hypothetical protein QOF20_457 [Acidimicrobiaceae bacterium]|jgi:hypothetical protein|nr:hypothetical protein [Acidimicrobiaceae bacterium]MDQ1368104.1 hypothetical protein [Acidimicrobiaceae bacterium]MDQ1377107.1 hypothetical protein [Acidimicrobiaceae bacterium]MDQ1401075.1 hypothetical protein [Acidimicrobiaceae bacterium]MDQ1414589.1 hypothetical protein [Acidimicrobiaceae bacterium]